MVAEDEEKEDEEDVDSNQKQKKTVKFQIDNIEEKDEGQEEGKEKDSADTKVEELTTKKAEKEADSPSKVT